MKTLPISQHIMLSVFFLKLQDRQAENSEAEGGIRDEGGGETEGQSAGEEVGEEDGGTLANRNARETGCETKKKDYFFHLGF